MTGHINRTIEELCEDCSHNYNDCEYDKIDFIDNSFFCDNWKEMEASEDD